MALRDAGPTTDSEPKLLKSAPAGAERRRLSRGVWIRLAIYLPLLGFFGWQAGQKALTERKAADEAFRDSVAQWLKHQPRTIVLPNGETMPVLEITEAEAAALGLIPEGAKQPDDEASAAAPKPSEPSKTEPVSPPASTEAAPTGAAPNSGDTAGAPAPQPSPPANE